MEDYKDQTVLSNKSMSKLAGLVIFGLFVLATASIMLQVNRIYPLSGSVDAGLAMIPAWAWKNFIERDMTWNDPDLPAWASTAINSSLALLAALCSAALQLLSEWCLKRAKEDTLVYTYMQQLGASLGLGCGFAVNRIFKTAFASRWSKVWFQMVYAGTLTLILPPAQTLARQALGDRLQRRLPRKLCNFLILSFNFLLSWAWKGLIDAIFLKVYPVGIFMEAVWITVLGSTVAFSASHSTNTRFREGAMLVSGMNIGWQWLDWCKEIFLFHSELDASVQLWVGTATLLLPLLVIQIVLMHPVIAPTHGPYGPCTSCRGGDDEQETDDEEDEA
jgi:hypothetical protein